MSPLSVILGGAGGLGWSTTVEWPAELLHDNIMEELIISACVELTAASVQTTVLANEVT